MLRRTSSGSISYMAQVSSGARLQTSAPTPSPTSATRQSPAGAGARGRNRLFERSAVVVVGQFLRHPADRSSVIGQEPLGAVDCRAVEEYSRAPSSDVDNLVHAEEGSSIDDVAETWLVKARPARTELTPIANSRTGCALCHTMTIARTTTAPISERYSARRADRRRRGCRGASVRAPTVRIAAPSRRQFATSASSRPGLATSVATSKMGYSAMVLKSCGATRAAKIPPSAPPNDIQR